MVSEEVAALSMLATGGMSFLTLYTQWPMVTMKTVNASKQSCISALTLFIFDYVLTIPEEVRSSTTSPNDSF
ncbi:hypothetical protein M422DRAFT_267596 [Sphaerobolus stellatus SS14]|uniref:DUF6533 domain-containing protein n=1 Tax=Sphaerobolus stellatus (strain SS14) TaxID=990650 RepID=A0A0C9V0F3_SPHS4|nr:hypothetical protein M422DRAFT_267596 [Sphaerobolus stellatus SS14]